MHILFCAYYIMSILFSTFKVTIIILKNTRKNTHTQFGEEFSLMGLQSTGGQKQQKSGSAKWKKISFIIYLNPHSSTNLCVFFTKYFQKYPLKVDYENKPEPHMSIQVL